MQNITEESDLNDLTILGQPAEPGKTLETFPNHHPARDYTVTLATNEFTCLCPKTGQPDFAKITISYIPNKALVESKSLKLYLTSFRNEGAFHEHVTNTILDDLKKAMAPRWCKVTAEFAIRGGISIVINAEDGKAPSTSSLPVATPVRTEEKARREEPAMAEKSSFTAAAPHWERGGAHKPSEWEQKNRPRTNYGKPPEESRFERKPYRPEGETRPYKRPEENRFERGKPSYQGDHRPYKRPEENRFERKPYRPEGDTRPYKRPDGPAKTEEKPNWEKKKSERRTTKSLGETRTWRKRT